METPALNGLIAINQVKVSDGQQPDTVVQALEELRNLILERTPQPTRTAGSE